MDMVDFVSVTRAIGRSKPQRSRVTVHMIDTMNKIRQITREPGSRKRAANRPQKEVCASQRHGRSMTPRDFEDESPAASLDQPVRQ